MPRPSRSTASSWVSEGGLRLGHPTPARDPACGRPVARRALSLYENHRRGDVPARPQLRQRLLLLLRRDGFRHHRSAAADPHPAPRPPPPAPPRDPPPPPPHPPP